MTDSRWPVAGHVADHLLQRGRNATFVRKLIISLSLGGVAPSGVHGRSAIILRC